MARDEDSNGNGNGNGNGKSGRQDSSLSARRARLRSLAKQALPPDPYSKKQDPQGDESAAGFEFMDQQQGTPAVAPPQPPQQSQPVQQNAEPWLDEAMKAIAQGPAPEVFPGVQQQPGMPLGQDPISGQHSPITEHNYGANGAYGQFPPDNQFPPDPFHQAQAQFPTPQPQAQFPQGQQQFPHEQPQFPQEQAQFPQEQTPHFGQQPDLSHYAVATAQTAPVQPPPNPAAADIFGAQDGESFEDFMQGPAESPTAFMGMSQESPAFGQAPIGTTPVMPSEPNTGSPYGTPHSEHPQLEPPHQSVSQSIEVNYLPHSSDKDFTSSLDLDYGDLDDTSTPPNDEPQPPATETATPIAEQQPEPETEPESRPWAVNKPVGSLESQWPEGDDGTKTVARNLVTEPPREPIPTKPEEPPKEQTPTSKKKNRRKSNVEETVTKEPELKGADEPVEEESEPQDVPEVETPEKTSKVSASSKNVEEEKPEPKERAEKNVQDPSPSRTADMPAGAVVPVELLTKSQAEALELLTSIDQALGICAMNLSSLQSASIEQTDVIKNLRETLQNQTFFELGLNLNTLMESMSAALEPMKAVGELVPAIDQLVSAMVAQEDTKAESRLTPDKLVMSLADQLGSGQIDPWTFKCAYMAVHPDEHPADLLRRLVDLLGMQRLSGDMFRSAYDAVQAAEPPRRVMNGDQEVIEVVKEVIKEVEVVKVVPDEEVLRQLEDLRRANEDLKALVDAKDSDVGARFEEREREMSQRLDEKEQEFNKRLSERETEFAELLASKEHEIQETQEMLHSRFEEFNSRYEEMVETVNQRDEELKVKDDDLMRKESEITQLKAQLDELKDSFKDTVDNLQKQLTSTQKAAQEASMQAQAVAKPDEPQKPATNFFDTEANKPAPIGNFLDSPQAQRPLFQNQMDTFNSMSKAPPQQGGGSSAPPTPGGPPSEPKPFGGGSPPTGPVPEPSNQAVPKPPVPSPGMSSLTGTGSYGSGVRAQVFEVIVRQALAGAPWREICAGPMSVNNISPDEVETEVKRREQLLKK